MKKSPLPLLLLTALLCAALLSLLCDAALAAPGTPSGAESGSRFTGASGVLIPPPAWAAALSAAEAPGGGVL